MQLKRPATTSAWSNARGGQQAQRGENTVKQVCLVDVCLGTATNYLL